VGDFYCTEPGSYREHYIRDAQGNIMATYRYKLIPVPNTTTQLYEASLKLNERPLYGSSRLGSLRTEVELRSLPSFDPTSANPVQQVDLNYELTDHLGNVCAVVTGRLLDGNGGGTPKQAELVSAQGYEPFGSLLPGRNYSSDSYRFGFGGQLKDDEVYGSTGTSYTAEFWQYDPRTARRWNVDPESNSQVSWSTYSVYGDNPIFHIDPNGKKFINFDASGKYIGTSHNTRWHNFWHGSKGRMLSSDGKALAKFRFADPKHDVPDIQSGRIDRLIVPREDQIKGMLVRAGAFEEANRVALVNYLNTEGRAGGKFDFSFTGIPAEFGVPGPTMDEEGNWTAPSLFLVNGVAHNHMNFGNFMFGAGGATLGAHLLALQLGAHKNSRLPEDHEGKRIPSEGPFPNGYEPKLDSRDDQFSIAKGYDYAKGGLISRFFGGRSWDKEKPSKEVIKATF
jgi:hypothetical protein